MTDPEFCDKLLNGRRHTLLAEFDLTDEEQLALTDNMGGKMKLTGQFNRQTVDDNVYQVTLDKDINPQPEYVLGTYYWHMDGMPIDEAPPFDRAQVEEYVANGFTHIILRYSAPEFDTDALHQLVAWRDATSE